MQDDFSLTVQHVLERMPTLNSGAEMVPLCDADRVTPRASRGEVTRRIDRLAAALQDHGIEQGDRVGTFAWNSRARAETLRRGGPVSG
jgi:acyl-CoA synthetase (AMP-forming)/AMP-acid ligase II